MVVHLVFRSFEFQWSTSTNFGIDFPIFARPHPTWDLSVKELCVYNKVVFISFSSFIWTFHSNDIGSCRLLPSGNFPHISHTLDDWSAFIAATLNPIKTSHPMVAVTGDLADIWSVIRLYFTFILLCVINWFCFEAFTALGD